MTSSTNSQQTTASLWNVTVRGCSCSLKMVPFDRSYTTFYWSAIVSMLYHFQRTWRWIIVTLKRSLKVIQTGTIQKLGCGFLFAFHSNHGSILHRLRDKGRYWSKIPPMHLMPPVGDVGSRPHNAETVGTNDVAPTIFFDDLCQKWTKNSLFVDFFVNNHLYELHVSWYLGRNSANDGRWNCASVCSHRSWKKALCSMVWSRMKLRTCVGYSRWH